LKRVEGKKDEVYLKISKKKTPVAMSLVKDEKTKMKLDLLLDRLTADVNVPLIN